MLMNLMNQQLLLLNNNFKTAVVDASQWDEPTLSLVLIHKYKVVQVFNL